MFGLPGDDPALTKEAGAPGGDGNHGLRRLSLLSNSGFEELTGFFVHEVDVAALHATCKQDTIGVFDEIYELVLGALNHGVAGFLFDAYPALAGAINEVLAEMTPM